MDQQDRQSNQQSKGAGFVGRTRELAELLAGLEDVAAGRGRLFLVIGEAGIGKTRLLEEVSATATQRGCAVLWGRCREGAGAPPYWPWVQAIRSHLRQVAPEHWGSAIGAGAAYLAQLIPEVQERFPTLPAAPTSPESEHARFYLFDAATTFFKNASTATPLVLVFDDLHWADLPSLLLLQFLAHEMRDARILLVGTYREVEARQAPAVAEVLGAVVRNGHHLPLRGLSEEEVRLFIETIVGRSAPAALVHTVYRNTEGNPFFIDEIVRVLAAEGALEVPDHTRPGRVPIPQGVRETIRRRLAPLPAACKDVLTVASVIGREFTLAGLQRACTVEPEQLLEILGDALVSEIILYNPGAPGRYRFAHALIRETLYEGLTPAHRMRLHSLVGRVLEALYQVNLESHPAASSGQALAASSGQALAEIAHHFIEAAPGGDADKGVEYTVHAARHAVASLAYEDAVEHYARALQVLTLSGSIDEGQRCALLLARGEAQWKAGDGPGARTTFEQAADIARRIKDPVLFARSALGCGGEGSRILGVESSNLDEPLIALLEEALASLGERVRGLRVLLLARLSLALYFSASWERGVELSAQAGTLARQEADPQVLAAALRARCVALWRPQSGDEQLTVAAEIVQLAERIGDRELALPGHKFRIMGFLERGDLTAVDREIATWARIATALRQPLYLAYLAMWRAMRATLEGRFAEGQHQAQLARELGRQTQEVNVTGHFGVQMIILRVQQGRFEEVAQAIQAIRAFVDRSTTPSTPLWRCCLAYLYGELGREAEAWREFAAVAEDDFASLPQSAYWLMAMSFLATACANLGDRQSAAILYQRLLPYAGLTSVVGAALTCRGSVSHSLGELAATLGRVADAERHFEEALQVHERMGARPLVAWTEHTYARMLLLRSAVGDQEKAQELLGHARATAQALGMDGLAAKIRALPSESASLPSQQELTDGSPAAGGLSAPPPATALSRVARVFHREGEFWTIAYEGKVVRLKDAKGLQDIAMLLSHPGKEIHVADLIAASTDPESDPRVAAYRQMSANQLAEQGVQGAGGTALEPVLDRHAQNAYRARVAELRRELEEAEQGNDPGRVARARAELDFIAGELAAAYGLGGHGRTFGTPVERARKAVTWRIRSSVARIGHVHPALGRHADQFIKTGTFCAYAVPEESARWSV